MRGVPSLVAAGDRGEGEAAASVPTGALGGSGPAESLVGRWLGYAPLVLMGGLACCGPEDGRLRVLGVSEAEIVRNEVVSWGRQLCIAGVGEERCRE